MVSLENGVINGLCEYKRMSMILVILEKFNELADENELGDRGENGKIIKENIPLNWNALSLKILKLFTELKISFEQRQTFKYNSLLFNLVEIVNKMHDISWKNNSNYYYGIDSILQKKSQSLNNIITRFIIEVFQASGTWVPRNTQTVININMIQVLKNIQDYINIAKKYTEINYLEEKDSPNSLFMQYHNHNKYSHFGKLCDFKFVLKIENIKQEIGDGYLNLILELSEILNKQTDSIVKKESIDMSDMKSKVVQNMSQYIHSIGFLSSVLKFSWVVMDDENNALGKLSKSSTALLNWLDMVILSLPYQFEILLLHNGTYPYDISIWREGYDLAIQCTECIELLTGSNKLISECVKKIPSIRKFDSSPQKTSSTKQIRKMLSKTCILLGLRKKLNLVLNLCFEEALGLEGQQKCLLNPVSHKNDKNKLNNNKNDECEKTGDILLDELHKNRKSSTMKYLLNELNSEYGSEKIYNISENEVVYVKGIPKYATWDGLINLISPPNKPADSDMMRCFFLTFRYYGSSLKLFHSLLEKFEEKECYKDSPQHIRVFNCIKIWIERYYFKERDYQILPILRDFLEIRRTELFFPSSVELKELISELMKTHLKKISYSSPVESKTRNAKGFSFVTKISTKMTEKSIFANNSLNFEDSMTHDPNNKPIFKWDQESLAQLITMFDSDYYNNIEAQDIMSFSLKQPTAKIQKMIEWNNRLSFYVIENILVESVPKKRALFIKNMIKLGERLFKINNFNSLMSILSGLNNSSIRRLNLTWSLVSPKYLYVYEYLNKIFDPIRNFKTYRNLLEKINASCVPFFGIFLSDLTFVNEGNPIYSKLYPNLTFGSVTNYTTSIKTDQLSIINKYNFAEEEIEVINLDKFKRMTKIVDEIERLQKPYNQVSTLDKSKLFALKKELSTFPLSKKYFEPFVNDERLSLLEFSDLRLSCDNNDYYYYSRHIEPPTEANILAENNSTS